jgi:hypothetical protein
VAVAAVGLSGHALTAEADTPATLDPCALVAKVEVEKIIGELREAPKPDRGLQQEKECNYTNNDGAWLKVSIYSSQRWGMQKGIVSEMNPAPFSGLGEEAFTVKRGTTCEVYVRQGKWILEVSSTVGAERTQQFAQIAATRLADESK